MLRVSTVFLPVVIVCLIFLTGCVGLVSGVDQVTVSTAGGGTGTVTSTPQGITCASPSSGTCQATFNGTPAVTLTAAPGQGFTFGGWTGCKSATGTSCTVSGAATVTATFTASLQSINHIIFLVQENRSFDSYFGAMRQYWSQNGYPDQSFDGLPQFNPATGAAPNTGPAPSNPGCDPASSTATNCNVDSGSQPVTSFHFQTQCVENPSPFWNEAHVSWDYSNPVVPPPPPLNGFVQAAANDARQIVPPFNDVNGLRGMGYYDGGDLNYYYFMASNFATSDRWFAPAMTRTDPNRHYLIGGTSYGYVYPNGSNANDQAQIPSPPIFQILQQQNPPITWKIYVDPSGTGCNSTDSACLFNFTYVKGFNYGNTILQTPTLLQNIVPISQFMTDAQNGTLPQVAQIEPASNAGLDEHPSDTDPAPGNSACCSVQVGANYVAGLINAVMNGPSWANSIFVLSYDEWGGFYDHVAPQPAVSPDNIPPVDLNPGDVCTSAVGPNCDFVFTGYRVPMIVISPYAKKNYVSHAVADNTAILKLIETRFGLHSLTARDANQIDMSQEFFDFTNAPWRKPPSPPAQNTTGQCYLDHLP